MTLNGEEDAWVSPGKRIQLGVPQALTTMSATTDSV